MGTETIETVEVKDEHGRVLFHGPYVKYVNWKVEEARARQASSEKMIEWLIDEVRSINAQLYKSPSGISSES